MDFPRSLWISPETVEFGPVFQDSLVLISYFQPVKFLIKRVSVPVCYLFLFIERNKSYFSPFSLQVLKPFECKMHIIARFKFLKFLDYGDFGSKIVFIR